VLSINNSRTHHMRVDYNTYEGFETYGHADVVISRGKVVVEGDSFQGRVGAGQFIKRARHGELLRA
jgi:dihydropyrimidinase